MDDPDDDVRRVAAHLVAVIGDPAHAERLAATMGTVGDVAVWGLARLGDARCVAPLLDHLTGKVPGFCHHSAHYAGDHYRVDLPGLHEVLQLIPQYAGDLLPAVRARLRTTSSPDERRSLCQAITAWGPAAADAVPELITLLNGNAATWAAEALAATGPAAGAALPHLRRMAAEADPRLRSTAAWALWKVGGDPQIAPDVPRTEDLRLVADLGPVAGSLLPQVRGLLDSRDAWTRARAAHAVWAISGEPDLVMPVLLEIVRPLGEGRTLPVMRAAVRTLGEIGPAAAPVVPLLDGALATDRRLSDESGWRAIDGDEAFRSEITDALARIGKP